MPRRYLSPRRRRAFIDATNAAYAAARREPVAWAAILAERAAWDVTLADGLSTEPPWPAESAPPPKGRRTQA